MSLLTANRSRPGGGLLRMLDQQEVMTDGLRDSPHLPQLSGSFEAKARGEGIVKDATQPHDRGPGTRVSRVVFAAFATVFEL